MTPNPTGLAETRVEERDLASDYPGFPPVFSTARMLRLMEIAAARCLEPVLGAGELSVGVSADIEHVAATPLGATVKARADFVEQTGKLYWFEVSAHDEGGLVGEGRHARAIVQVDRLVAAAHHRTRR